MTTLAKAIGAENGGAEGSEKCILTGKQTADCEFEAIVSAHDNAEGHTEVERGNKYVKVTIAADGRTYIAHRTS